MLDIKKKIGDIFSVLKFNGEILRDNMTISDYGIEDGDLLYLSIKLIGCETGSASKTLADPTKNGPIKIKTVTEGSFYLTVNDGINLFGNCYNKQC